MKWTRKQYLDLMTFQNSDTQMFCELFGLLIGLDDEWKQQGATEGQLNLTEFGFDYLDLCYVGGTGAIHPLPETVLEEDDAHIVKTDYLGRTVKMCKGTATLPLPLDYPVKDREDWKRIRHMFGYEFSRIHSEELARAIEAQQNGALVWANIPGGFDILRELMGEEIACLAFYEQPELVVDILSTISETNRKVLGRISEQITIDNLTVHEEMAGAHAPMVGPNIVDEFFAPYYHETWDLLKSRGTKLFSQDSDGNMNPVIDSFIRAGVNVFYPCEPAAGMDVVALRQKYGKTIAFKGGLDKHVLRRSKEEILRELEYKMQPCMQEGGMVFALDHRIPNGTPLTNYVYYVQTARALLGLPPLEAAEKDWGRMAF